MDQMTIKKMNVADAGGWYMAEAAVRKYTRSTGADGHRNRQATPEAVRGQYNE